MIHGKRNLNWIKMQKNTPKKLREFGFLTGAIFVLLFGLLLPLLKKRPLPLWPWGVALVLWPQAIFTPHTLDPFYKVWMKVGHALGWVNSRIILSIFFYLIVTPIGFFMRLTGKNPLERGKTDIQEKSYRINCNVQEIKSMEEPF
jgi:hypothetical protein